MAAAAFPEISVISNITEGGVARGEAGDGELRWHSDHGFAERPAAYTMHRRDGFAGHGRRRMHRLMTLGERPF